MAASAYRQRQPQGGREAGVGKPAMFPAPMSPPGMGYALLHQQAMAAQHIMMMQHAMAGAGRGGGGGRWMGARGGGLAAAAGGRSARIPVSDDGEGMIQSKRSTSAENLPTE